jgi:hypothetical protein
LRSYKKDITIFLGLLTLTLIVWLLTLRQSEVDIQLHDTYYVFDRTSLIILILGPLTFLIFLARGLTSKFRSIGANVALFIGLILVALITYRIIEFQKSYLAEIQNLECEGLTERQFIIDMKSKSNWTWGLFSLWIIGSLLLALQTIKIWKGKFGTDS